MRFCCRMVAGRLVDSRGEFFIQRQRAASGSSSAAGDAAEGDARAAEWHQGFQVGSIIHATCHQQLGCAARRRCTSRYCCGAYRWRCQTCCPQVRPELLPAHISLATAEAVLFIGKAARVLQGANWSAAAPSISPADSSLPVRLPLEGSLGLAAQGSGGGIGQPFQSCQPGWDGLSTALWLQRMAAQPQFDPLAFAAGVDASHKQVSRICSAPRPLDHQPTHSFDSITSPRVMPTCFLAGRQRERCGSCWWAARS